MLTPLCARLLLRPPLRSKCNASLSLTATLGEEPEIEVEWSSGYAAVSRWTRFLVAVF